MSKYPDPAMASADVGLVKLLYLEVFSSGNPVQEARDLLESSVHVATETDHIS